MLKSASSSESTVPKTSDNLGVAARENTSIAIDGARPHAFLSSREFRIHGVKVHAVQTAQVLAILDEWVRTRHRFSYLSSTNTNNIVMALESQAYFKVMENASLSVPDSVPFLWMGQMRGFTLPERCGIEEVMLGLFELSNQGHNYSHYFYGNTPDVLRDLERNLRETYPSINIAGMHSPPFRTLSPEEDQAHINMINAAQPDFLWVSLGCPKQETWLYEHRDRLNVVLGGGAGAVFNFLAGHTPRAPRWIRKIGMEWLLRLMFEPSRLWKRYLIKYPKFFWYYLFPTKISASSNQQL